LLQILAALVFFCSSADSCDTIHFFTMFFYSCSQWPSCVYVGETGRPLGARVKGHRKEVDSMTGIFLWYHKNLPVSTLAMLITSTVEICIQHLGRVEKMVFTARRSYACAVLGVVILSVCPFVRLSVCPSICPSVHLSHVCFVTNPKNLPSIFFYHMKGQSF